jgi:hypothetical protein
VHRHLQKHLAWQAWIAGLLGINELIDDSHGGSLPARDELTCVRLYGRLAWRNGGLFG